MKKMISILMIMVMLVSMLAVATTANTVDASQNMYLEDFILYYSKNYYYTEQELNYMREVYRELCYHYSDENNESPDWVLIECQVYSEPWEMKYGALVGDRILWTYGGSGLPFMETGLGVYIPKTDTLIGLFQKNVEQIIELCPEFVETIEKNKLGQLMGDVNDDKVINILDATYIQRILAGYTIDHLNTGVWDGDIIFGISDFNRDGETTILDATAIQRKLAKLD